MKKESFPSITMNKNITLQSMIGEDVFEQLLYPHRFEQGCFIFVVKGTAKVEINLSDFNVKCNDVITLVPGSIIHLKESSNDLKLKAIAFSSEFIKEIALLQYSTPYVTYISNNPVLNISRETVPLLQKFCTLLFKIHSRIGEMKNHSIIIKSMLTSLLYGIITAYEIRGGIDSKVVVSRSEEIARELRNLILKHYMDERSVGFYASKLFITPKYLSDVIKHTTGRTVSDLISEVVILDAKTQLKSTANTIQQISDSLNFPNQSFFAKYFKKHVGVSPKSYRVEYGDKL